MERDRLKDLAIGQRMLLKSIIKKCNGDAWARLLWHIYLNINQLDALSFIMSLFHASACFEHMCSSSGGQNCTIQHLVSSHL